MKKNPLKSKAEIALMMMVLFSMLVFNAMFLNVKAETSTTTVSVVPTSQVVGEEGKLLPESLTVDVTVTNVTELFAWQTTIWYSPRILRVTDVTFANETGHVFENFTSSICPEPEITNWTKKLTNETTVDFSDPIGTRWFGVEEGPVTPKTKAHYNITGWLDLDNSTTVTESDIIFVEPNLPVYVAYYYVDRISWRKFAETGLTTVELDISMASIQCSATLLAADDFTGSAILSQITFDAIRPGNSILNFSGVNGTDLYNSTSFEYDDPPPITPMEFKNGSVTVLGIPAVKDTSEITIEANPSSVIVGSNVTISGMIIPSRQDVNVKIEQKPAGSDAWTELATVVTDSIGVFTCPWSATEVGTHEFRASWEGDTLYDGHTSEPVTVEVTEEGGGAGGISDYLLYIIIGIVIAIVAVAVLYFVKIRKTRT